MRKNWRKYLRNGISVLLVSLASNLPSAEKETQKQQYQPRVFEEPILIERGKADHVSLAFEPETNKLGIVYTLRYEVPPYYTKHELKYAEYTQIGCNIGSVVSDLNRDSCSLAFNPATKQPAIAGAVSFFSFDGSNWQAQKLVTTDYGRYLNSLAFHPETNLPWIAGNSMGDWNLYLWAYDGINWNPQRLGWVDAVFESLKFDLNNQPCIAYEVNGWSWSQAYLNYYGPEPYYNPNTEPFGRGPFVIDTAFHDSTSLVIDRNNYPCISYGNNPTTSSYPIDNLVRYTHWDGTNWQTETVDNNFKAGSTSLLLDTSDNPIIAYVCNNGDVRLATKNGGNWHIQTLTNNPNIRIGTYPIVFISSVITNINKIICAYSVGNYESGEGVWLIAEQGALPKPTAVPRKIWQKYK